MISDNDMILIENHFNTLRLAYGRMPDTVKYLGELIADRKELLARDNTWQKVTGSPSPDLFTSEKWK